ncbi:hypothetical protein [Embleya sp. AB8]|uniref:hypothetical protein n=1 Tax=Embleya sp. AB8 TaxID=3156304 RepID=UPI003C77FEF2
MPTFDQVLNFDVGSLNALADNWQRLQQSLQGKRDQANQQVIAPLTSAVWSGQDAKAAAGKLRGLLDQLEAAHNEAGAIASILRDAAGDIGRAQTALRGLVDEARTQGLQVKPDGGLTWTAGTDALAANMAATQKAAAESLGPRIAEALRSATDADTRASAALRADVDYGAADKFNASAVGGGPAADAVRANDLFGRLRSLNPKELGELENLVHNNKNDPAFTEPLMIKLGPDGLLDKTLSLAELTSHSTPGDPRIADMRLLQQDLGTSLASASPKLIDNKDWMTRLREASRKEILLPEAKNQSIGSKVTGFQMLGVLLENGNYDSRFLRTVAEDTLSYEQQKGKPPIWGRDTNTPMQFPLDLSGTPGGGVDPMIGVMKAVSHDPKVALDFFSGRDQGPDGRVFAPGEMHDRLNYLLNERGFPSASVGAYKEAITGAYLDAAGKALQAGATGIPYGQPPDPVHPAPPHSAASAALVGEVVKIYGQGDHQGQILAELRGSITNSLTPYIADVHGTLNALPGSPVDPPAGGWNVGSSAVFRRNELSNVLYGLSADPKSAALLLNAEQVYGMYTINAQPYATEPRMVENAWKDTANSLSVINAARNQAAADLAAGDDAKYNHAVLWESKALYHGPGFLLNLAPGVSGDLLQRGMNLLSDFWAEKETVDSSGAVTNQAADNNLDVETRMSTLFNKWAAQEQWPVGADTHQIQKDLGREVHRILVEGTSDLKFTQGRQ